MNRVGCLSRHRGTVCLFHYLSFKVYQSLTNQNEKGMSAPFSFAKADGVSKCVNERQPKNLTDEILR